MAFNCNKCPYMKQQPINLKFENNNSNHLLVFQAPGYDEWNGGLLTMSGRKIPIDSANSHSCAARMRNSFLRKGVARTDFDIAEAVCCYPGRLANGRDKKPRLASIRICTNNMMSLLIKKNYGKITCFGNIAYKVVNDAISLIAGWNGPTPVQAPHPSGHVTNEVLDASY